MSTSQEAATTSGLTRRLALTQVAVGGVAAIAFGSSKAAAQDATAVPGAGELSPLELARLAADFRNSLAPVIVKVKAGSNEEFVQAAKDYIEQLKAQDNVTEEEATALQQIVEHAIAGDGEDQTKIEKLQDIADSFSEDEDGASPAALAIALIAVAIARRDERSESSDTASPVAEETDLWDRVKSGLLGALAGAAIGGLISDDNGAVVGAIAGGLAGAL